MSKSPNLNSSLKDRVKTRKEGRWSGAKLAQDLVADSWIEGNKKWRNSFRCY